jgi:hypothetical protein
MSSEFRPGPQRLCRKAAGDSHYASPLRHCPLEAGLCGLARLVELRASAERPQICNAREHDRKFNQHAAGERARRRGGMTPLRLTDDPLRAVDAGREARAGKCDVSWSFPSPAFGERRHRGLARGLIAVRRRAVFVIVENQRPHPRRAHRRGSRLHDTDRRRLADRVRASEAFRALCGLWLDLNFSHCGLGDLAPIYCGGGRVLSDYEPGYTGHWEMKKRRKETKE